MPCAASAWSPTSSPSATRTWWWSRSRRGVPVPGRQGRGFDSLVQTASGIGWATSADKGASRCPALPAPRSRHRLLLAAAPWAPWPGGRAPAGWPRCSYRLLAPPSGFDQPRPRQMDTAPSGVTEGDIAPYRVPLRNGWSGIRPPGRLDGRPLSWPHLPPHYGGDPPRWSRPTP